MKLLMRRGTQELPIDSASAGSIICLSGFRNASVNHTICDKGVTNPIKAIPIDPPSISMKVSTNDSPLAGQEGKAVTTRELGEWLEKEAETNVSLTVTRAEEGDAYEVFGRGELQLVTRPHNTNRRRSFVCWFGCLHLAFWLLVSLSFFLVLCVVVAFEMMTNFKKQTRVSEIPC